MRPLSHIFTAQAYPNLLVGLSQPDDAAVYQLNEQQAVISTTDFFPPVVDDPYAFGAIAAANALSDIYAVGGEPLMAINLVAYPDGLGLEILSEILRGGAEKVREAGAVIAGGHTVTDKEPKYGLAVTGRVHPAEIITKGGAVPGDKLILSKPLGTGVVTTALKQGKARPEHVEAAVISMSRLNREASRMARQWRVNAMTDITGYSLLGHGHEMAHLGHVDFVLSYGALKWLPGSQAYAEQGIFPGGMQRNQDYFSTWVDFHETIGEAQRNLLFDPQTSGGLLMAVPAAQSMELLAALIDAGDEAAVVGEVQPGDGRLYVVV